MACCVRAFVTMRQHKSRRAEVEREAQQGGDEEDGGEGAEIERFANEHHGHQNNHREGDGNGQTEIDNKGGDRQDQESQNDHQPDAEP